MRFIGDFQRESCRKRLPLSTAAWLAQQKSDGLLSGRSRFQTPAEPAQQAFLYGLGERTRNESQRPREKWLSFHFSRGQNRKSPSSVFLCPETKRKRLPRRLTPARTNTQGLREQGEKFCLCNDICKRLDFLVFSDKNEKSQAPSNSPYTYNEFYCERNYTLFVKSKGPGLLCDGVLKFTFTLGCIYNSY